MEWKEITIGDLGNVITGKTPKTSIAENYGGEIPFLSPSDDMSHKYAPKTGKTLSQLGLKEVSKCYLPTNAICVSCIGSDLGKVVIANRPLVTNQQINSIIVNDDYDVDYIYYLLTIIGKELNFLSKTSTAVPIINKSTFSNWQIKVPCLKDVQTKIANILSSLDAKIENNNKINANLEAQASALFKSWFVDFEPFKDGEFMESELGMIPKGWKVSTLDTLCSFISRGLAPKYNDTTDEWILGQTCVRNNIVTLNNARKHLPKTRTEKWVKQWDILLNSTGIGSLGRVGIVYFDKDNVAFDTHITVVRVANPLYRHYVGRNLLARQLEIENMAVGSTGQTELPKDSVKTMQIIIPESSLLEQFNKIIEPIGKKMISNIEENKYFEQTRDTLLPKLMSGEIEI